MEKLKEYLLMGGIVVFAVLLFLFAPAASHPIMDGFGKELSTNIHMVLEN